MALFLVPLKEKTEIHKKVANDATWCSSWWFQILYIALIWVDDPIWRACFSNGLKPPASVKSVWLKMISIVPSNSPAPLQSQKNHSSCKYKPPCSISFCKPTATLLETIWRDDFGGFWLGLASPKTNSQKGPENGMVGRRSSLPHPLDLPTTSQNSRIPIIPLDPGCGFTWI